MNFKLNRKNSNSHLSVKKAVEILQSEDKENLDEWQSLAQEIVRRTTNSKISYTTNAFIPVTFLCRNACSYCNYRKKDVPRGEEYISKKDVSKLLIRAQEQRVSEILITTGEKPEEVSPEAENWLLKNNFNSTIDYIHFIAKSALSKGLLPHINAGSIEISELRYLKQVSASMGVMLENISSRLRQVGLPHNQSPDKDPKKRLSTIKIAGKLKIPFTTGLLIGIGESSKEIVASLFALKSIQSKFNHIQEVIIQPYIHGISRKNPELTKQEYQFLKRVIIVARNILPETVAIQTPPNLVSGFEEDVIKVGISDWGGISPVTIDHINPKKSWPKISTLKKISQACGYSLVERLPIYPQYLKTSWLSPSVYDVIQDYNLAKDDGMRNYQN